MAGKNPQRPVVRHDRLLNFNRKAIAPLTLLALLENLEREECSRIPQQEITRNGDFRRDQEGDETLVFFRRGETFGCFDAETVVWMYFVSF
jgi:hypothetical protein